MHGHTNDLFCNATSAKREDPSLSYITQRTPEVPSLSTRGTYVITHKTPLITAWLAKRPRYHDHFTPTSSAWINPVERFFSTLTTHWLQRGADRNVAALNARIYTFLAAYNHDPRPFTWKKTADDILASVA